MTNKISGSDLASSGWAYFGKFDGLEAAGAPFGRDTDADGPDGEADACADGPDGEADACADGPDGDEDG